MKSKKKYWAVGLNFDYDIVTEEQKLNDWGSVEGPFKTLREAQAQVRYWISTDRNHLSTELHAINNWRAHHEKA